MKRFDLWCQRLFRSPAWPAVLVVTVIPLLSACLCLPVSLPGLRTEETPVVVVQPVQTQIGPTATPAATATPTPTYTRSVRPAAAMPTATNTRVVYATWTHVPWTPTSTPRPRPTATLNVILPTSVPGATPTRTPTSIPGITGWLGAYYANVTLSGSAARIRDDPWIDFDWGTGSPASGIPADGFSARWTRSISFDQDTYRFYAQVDDGVRLWVDGHNVLNSWSDGPLREVSQIYPVAKGTHEIRVEYYDRTGQAAIHVWWSRVPEFYPDWKGSYYPNRSLSGEAKLVRNDTQIDFDWARDAPALGLPTDDFSVRWTRTVDFPDAVYRFVALADDGIRVSVSGQRIIDAWYDSAGDRVQVTEVALFGPHDVVVEYYEHRDDALVKVAWAPIRPGPARK
jgi:hypothetical protein